MSKDNGMPAFPATEANGVNSGCPGLTKREYFAAKALQGVMCDPNLDITCEETARLCVRVADALIAELAQ